MYSQKKKVTQHLLFIILCFPSLPHPPRIIIIWFYKIIMICKYFLKKAVLFFVHFIHTCNIFNPYYLLFIHSLNWKKSMLVSIWHQIFNILQDLFLRWGIFQKESSDWLNQPIRSLKKLKNVCWKAIFVALALKL